MTIFEALRKDHDIQRDLQDKQKTSLASEYQEEMQRQRSA